MTRISISQAADALAVTERMARRLCEEGVIGLALSGGQRKTYIVWAEKIEELMKGEKNET